MGLRSPTTSHADKFVSVFGPIMKSFGVEVRSIWPGQCPKRGIEFDGIEHLQILEGRKHFAFQDWTKVDPLPAAVLKSKRQRVRPDDVEMFDPMNGVTHDLVPPHCNGSILTGG